MVPLMAYCCEGFLIFGSGTGFGGCGLTSSAGPATQRRIKALRAALPGTSRFFEASAPHKNSMLGPDCAWPLVVDSMPHAAVATEAIMNSDFKVKSPFVVCTQELHWLRLMCRHASVKQHMSCIPIPLALVADRGTAVNAWKQRQ